MDALYCFCFASDRLPGDLDFSRCGWEDPVQVHAVAGFQVVMSQVPLERFSGPAAEARLADPAWVVPRAAAHDRVIMQAMRHATLYPLSLGTLFSSTRSLALELAQQRRILLDFFARMAGCTEWAVKVLMDRERIREHLTPQGDPHEGTNGRAYLLRQRRKAEAERALGPWLSERLAALDAEIEPLTEILLIRPARDPAVANRACLVTSSGLAAFQAAVARLQDDATPQGLELHCSGPWPLYSFRDLT